MQSLSPQEPALDTLPLTIYPKPQRVRVWGRFGAQHARVVALVVRSTDAAVGIEFVIAGQTYRCWVWGNAVELMG